MKKIWFNETIKIELLPYYTLCILIESDREMKGKQLHNSKDCLFESLFMIFRTHYQQEIKEIVSMGPADV